MAHIMIVGMNGQRTISYDFDRLGWLQRSGYLTRRILFLDLNYWISLYEERNDVYRELSKALHEEVDAGRLICPVSPSLLMEVQKRPRDERRYGYCQLMDRLSGRLSLRVGPAIFAEEFRALALGLTIEREVAYSFFLDAMSSGWRLNFPEGWTRQSSQQAARLAFDQFTSMSIPVAVNIPTDEQREQNITYLREGWSRLAQQAGEWREQNEEVSAREIEQAEFASTVQSLVPHAASFLLTEADRSVLTRLNSMSDDDKREMLEACPTFWCEYKVLAAVRSSRRTVGENDLWDLQHVASAAPYVDCLACDRGTRHICAQLVRMDEKYGTRIVARPDEILAWVRSLGSPS